MAHNKLSSKIAYIMVSAALLRAHMVYAQTPFEDAVKQLSSNNVKGYVQPFVNGFGANLNSGFSHTAEIGGTGLHVEFHVVGMGMLVGDAQKTYQAMPPQPFPQNGIETATIFGDEGTVVPGPAPGIDYHFQNGEVKARMLPFAVPQLTIGNVFGTQAVIRYVPLPEFNEFPRTTLFGGGLRHSVSQYIPGMPFDVAVGAFYEQFTIGEIFDAKGTSYNLFLSKSFSVATLYGGMQYETSTMKLDYTFQEGYSAPTKVHLELDGENKTRVIGGIGLNLVGVLLNADVNVGKVTIISAGVGVGF